MGGFHKSATPLYMVSVTRANINPTQISIQAYVIKGLMHPYLRSKPVRLLVYAKLLV
jgi:hypothetical protein